ncbi:MAG: hypothetical protein PWP23_327 [Candidatus Sumerlaeota bacterium]|nr:hypothetical protein [Candidatus Sumerlaeota bacterium]
MKRVFASIQLYTQDEGGRKNPLHLSVYRPTAFFRTIPALAERGRDFRMFATPRTPNELIFPGEVVNEVELRFLWPDDVLPYMQEGVRFSIWEGKTVGEGTVVRVEDDPSSK